MILVISHPDDYHARVVARLLDMRGERHVIADAAELGEGATLTLEPSDIAASRWTRRDGSSFHLGDVRAVWLRRYYPPVPAVEVTDSRARDFIRHQWSEALYGAFGVLDVPLINDPMASLYASKPRQLAIAARLGLRAPATLVTNDAGDALAFVHRHGGAVVHKTLRPALGAMLATKPWAAEDEAVLDQLTLAPTIFQQRVDGEREIRVTVVGRQVFAAEHRTALVDGRLDAAAPYTAHRLPAAISSALLAMVDALRLSYAAIDLRCYADGEYAFLEVTPQGQFLWIQIQAGLPIAEAVADLLIDATLTGMPAPLAGVLPATQPAGKPGSWS